MPKKNILEHLTNCVISLNSRTVTTADLRDRMKMKSQLIWEICVMSDFKDNFLIRSCSFIIQDTFLLKRNVTSVHGNYGDKQYILVVVQVLLNSIGLRTVSCVSKIATIAPIGAVLPLAGIIHHK